MVDFNMKILNVCTVFPFVNCVIILNNGKYICNTGVCRSWLWCNINLYGASCLRPDDGA